MPPSTAITKLNLPVIEAASQEGKSQPLSGSASTSVTNERVPKGTGEDSKGAAQQFSMGDGLPPVPAKVVDKILSGQFVDMTELLRDNMEVE